MLASLGIWGRLTQTRPKFIQSWDCHSHLVLNSVNQVLETSCPPREFHLSPSETNTRNNRQVVKPFPRPLFSHALYFFTATATPSLIGKIVVNKSGEL